VSGRKKSTAPIVERQYLAEPESCARALALLLQRPAAKEATPAGRPDDGTRVKGDSADGRIIAS